MAVFEWLFHGYRVQSLAPATCPPAVTPEMLKALAELVKVSGSESKGDGWWTSERIQAIASVVGAIAWPLTALTIVFIFRKPLLSFLSNVGDIEIAGAKFKRLQQELHKADTEASRKKELFAPPTQAEQERAVEVEELLEGVPSLIRKEADALAFEYEKVRASMPASDDRTRKMEIVVAKMRAIGRAVYPLRNELASSASAGKRLLAIAALQVLPDYDMLTWLAERIKGEKPFIGYHALLALAQAAKSPSAAAHRSELIESLRVAQSAKDSFGTDADRYRLLQTFEENVGQLAVASQT